MANLARWLAGVLFWSLCALGTATAQQCNCVHCGSNHNCVSMCMSQCETSDRIRDGAQQMRDGIERERQLLERMRAADWFGAVAMSTSNDVAASHLADNRAQAQALALKACTQRNQAGTCKVVREFKNQCAAATLAEGTKEPLVVVGPERATLQETVRSALAACNRKSTQCKVVFELCATADAAIDRYREEQRAAVQPVLDWMAGILGPLWGGSGAYKPRSNTGPTHEPVATTPLKRSRTFALSGQWLSALLMNAPNPPAHGPALTSGGPNLQQALAGGLNGQQFLLCDYSVGGSGAATRSFAFWYRSPPSDLDALMTIDVTNSLQLVGPKGFDVCPATYGAATAERDASQAYANTPRFQDIREAWRRKQQSNKLATQ